VGHVIRVESIEGRLIQAIEGSIQMLHEILLGQHQLLVTGTDGFSDLPRDESLTVFGLIKGEGESTDLGRRCLLRQIGDHRGVNAAREKYAERRIAGQVQVHTLGQGRGEILLGDGRLAAGPGQ